MPGTRIYPQVFDFNYTPDNITSGELGGFVFLDGWDAGIEDDDPFLGSFKGNPQAAAVLLAHLLVSRTNLHSKLLDQPVIGSTLQKGNNIVIERIMRSDGQVDVIIDSPNQPTIETINDDIEKSFAKDPALFTKFAEVGGKYTYSGEDPQLGNYRTIYKAAEEAEAAANFEEARAKYSNLMSIYPNDHNLGMPLAFIIKNHPQFDFNTPVVHLKSSGGFTTTNMLDMGTFTEGADLVKPLQEAQEKIKNDTILSFAVQEALEKKLTILVFDDEHLTHNEKDECACLGVSCSGSKSTIELAGRNPELNETYVHELTHYFVANHMQSENWEAEFAEAIALDKHQYRTKRAKNEVTSQQDKIYAVVVELTDQLYPEKDKVEEYFVRLSQKLAVEDPHLVQEVFPNAYKVFNKVVANSKLFDIRAQLHRLERTVDQQGKDFYQVLMASILSEVDASPSDREKLKAFVKEQISQLLATNENFRNLVLGFMHFKDFSQVEDLLAKEIAKLRDAYKNKTDASEEKTSSLEFMQNSPALKERKRLAEMANAGGVEAMLKLANILWEDAKKDKSPEYKYGLAVNYLQRAYNDGNGEARKLLMELFKEIAAHYQEQGKPEKAILTLAKLDYLNHRGLEQTDNFVKSKGNEAGLPKAAIDGIMRDLNAFIDQMRPAPLTETPQFKI